MSDLIHTEVIERILQAFISVIRRRTSESYAVVTMHTVIKDLEPKYDFLKYINIKDISYSEGINAISIMPDIDSVEPAKFYRAIDELIKSLVIYMERNAGFYFIKEFQESLGYLVNLALEERGVDLRFMQFEFIEDKKQKIVDQSKALEHVTRH